MLRIVLMLGALAAIGAVLVGSSPASSEKKAKPFPQVIDLPTGFRPEGLEVGRGTTFYVGSVANGAIYRGDLRSGSGAIFIPGAAGKSATGIELDRLNRLFVAGAATGNAYVYDAKTGALLRTYNLGTPPTFINDVVVTHNAAYFTDSQKDVLYRIPIGPSGALGNAQTMTLGGDYAHVAGATNLNGIDATPSGRTLVAVQTVNGQLYRINPTSGVATLISLGAESVPNGDGILLAGKTLYVVQNRLNEVAVIALEPGFASGRVVTRLSDSDFSVPTTIDDFGKRLYVVNARFGVPNPDTAAYQVVQLRKSKAH
jgi:outer membrane protein assembly factor BamB